MGMISEEEHKRRVLTVLNWMLNSHDKQRILNSGMELWKCSKVAMYGYYKDAEDYIAECAADEAKKYAALHVAKIDKLIAGIPAETLTTPAGLMAVKGLLDHQAKILNLFKTTVEVLPPVKEIGFKDMREEEK